MFKKRELKLKRTPRWERTNDVQGHKPKFNIRCAFCDMPMVLRHSIIYTKDKAKNEDETLQHNQMSYKCPRCAWFIQFMVIDDNKYLKKVVKKYRNGYIRLLPSNDEWSDEDELIKKQLAALGYWGGRV